MQWVVVRGAAVVNEIEAGLSCFWINFGQRHDLARMDNGGIKSGLHAFVQEHRVENWASSGIEAEAHIGKAKYRRRTRQFSFDPTNAFNGLDSIAAGLFHASR